MNKTAVLLLMPAFCLAAPQEVSCVSPVADSITWWQKNIKTQSEQCEARSDSECQSLKLMKERLADCMSEHAKWGQRYVFHLDISQSKTINNGNADVYFSGCGLGEPRKKPRIARVTASLNELLLDLSEPGLSATMVFSIDRATLLGGFRGERNFQCTATPVQSANKI